MRFWVKYNPADPHDVVVSVGAMLARVPWVTRVCVSDDESGDVLLDLSSAAARQLERMERSQRVRCEECNEREGRLVEMRTLVAELSRTMPDVAEVAELRAQRAALVAEVGKLRAKVDAARSELS